MSMSMSPKPPQMYQRFVRRYPKLSEAWDLMAEQGQEGPLDGKTMRLVKLGIAIGAMREGAVHSNVRKAEAMGITTEEMEQVWKDIYGLTDDASCLSKLEKLLADSQSTDPLWEVYKDSVSLRFMKLMPVAMVRAASPSY